MMEVDEESKDRVYEVPQNDIQARRYILVKRIEDRVRELIESIARNEKPSFSYDGGKNSGWISTNSNTDSNSISTEDSNSSGNNDIDMDSNSNNDTNIDSNTGSNSKNDINSSSNNDSSSNNYDSNISRKNDSNSIGNIDTNSISSHDSNSISNQDSNSSGNKNSNPISTIINLESESIANTTEHVKTIRFSGNESRQRFALIMRVLSHVHANLVKNLNRTEEDFYYTKRAFFYGLKNEPIKRFVEKQEQVEWAINEVTMMLECGPWEIGFISTSKGLIAGDLSFHLGDTRIINYERRACHAVPDVVTNVTRIRTGADFVLVVEKDSVFQKLLRENFTVYNNAILVTGKGYPDIPTRMLVHLLSEKAELPVYALVDANPHGFEIMCVYRFGTLNNLGYRQQLLCPKMRWLGVHQFDLCRLGIPRIKLTKGDLKKIEDLQTRSYVNVDFSKHLTDLKMGKAEIESVNKPIKHFLSEFFIPTKIRKEEYF